MTRERMKQILTEFYGVEFEDDPQRRRMVARGSNEKVIMSVSYLAHSVFSDVRPGGFSGPDDLVSWTDFES